MIVRSSLRRAFLAPILTILTIIIAMIPDLTVGFEFLRTNKIVLYMALLFFLITFYVLQTIPYLRHDERCIKYQGEISKADLKAAAVVQFLENYSPSLLIRETVKRGEDIKSFREKIIEKIPGYLLKLEEHLLIINGQKCLCLPHNIGEINLVPRSYLYMILGLFWISV